MYRKSIITPRTCHGCHNDDAPSIRCDLCEDGSMYRSAKDAEPYTDDAGEPIEYDERGER